MRIKKLVLENYRGLSAEVDVNPGVTGLLGVNGSGKSSLISGLGFSLAGKPVGDDKKSDLITWGEGKGSTRVHFEDDGVNYALFRNLHNSGSRLKATDGKIDLKKKDEVDDFVESVLGIGAANFDKAVFIPQERLDDVLMATHASRMGFFNELFGLAITDKIRALIQTEFIGRIRLYHDAPNEMSDLDGRFKEIAVALKHRGAELERAEKELMACQVSDDEVELTRNGMTAEAKEARGKSLREELAESRKLINELNEELLTKSAEFQLPEDGEARKAKKIKLLELQSRADEIKEKAARVEKLETPKTLVSGKHVEIDSRHFAYEFFKWEGRADVLEGKPCPVCGAAEFTGEKYDGKLVAEKRRETNEIGAKVTRYNREVVLKSRFGEELTKAENAVTEYLASLSREESKFDLDAYNVKVAELAESNSELRDVRRAVEKEEKRRNDLTKKLEELSSIPTVTSEERERVRKALDERERLLKGIGDLKAGIASLKTEAAGNRRNRERLEREAKENEKSERLRNDYESMRAILHRERLPKMVARRGVAAINKRLAEHVAWFELPYPVRINDAFDMVFMSPDGEERDFRSLSGGQRKAVAVAFRLAVAEKYGAAGMLVLDEPTAYMDERAVENFAETLSRVAAYSERKGFVTWVATHETRLESAVTRCLRVAEINKKENP